MTYNVRFVYSSNGHQFVEYDSFSGLTSAPRPMSKFPTPDELRARYEKGMGLELDAVNLLERLSDAGQMKRALFLCDRDELRRQALGGEV